MGIRFAVVLAVAVAANGALAGTATALAPGVFADPGSPAGKEYGVPLSDLRGAASGHVPVGNETPTLFGIGISPAGASGAAGSAAQARGGVRSEGQARARTNGHGGAPTGAANGGPSASQGEGAVLAGLTRHGSSTPALILIEVLVVIAGLGAGAALIAARRRLG